MPPNILLLQGPVGPFFKRFSDDLEQAGNKVFKINFNGGDQIFSNARNSYNFSGTQKDWPDFLQEKLNQLNIERIYLFGDCRYYHRQAKKLAGENGIELFVFEEGYLRPNFITLEKNGVNGHSDISKLPNNYRKIERPENLEHQILGSSFWHVAIYAIIYYLAAAVRSPHYPHYQHHRSFNPFFEGLKWIRSGWRKILFRFSERKVEKRLLSSNHPEFHLCVLQVHSDMQVQEHSEYGTIDEFINDCIASFAHNADNNTLLVIKHHPMDRGYIDYAELIHSLGIKYSIQDRILYIHDINLPTLLKHATGVVTINSTVGLSSLHHETPVKTLGHAIYDMPGLTSQLDLDSFWQSKEKIDTDLYLRFRAWLLRHNQVKGNLYRRFGNQASKTGLTWPSKLKRLHGTFDPKKETQIDFSKKASETKT